MQGFQGPVKRWHADYVEAPNLPKQPPKEKEEPKKPKSKEDEFDEKVKKRLRRAGFYIAAIAVACAAAIALLVGGVKSEWHLNFSIWLATVVIVSPEAYDIFKLKNFGCHDWFKYDRWTFCYFASENYWRVNLLTYLLSYLLTH